MGERREFCAGQHCFNKKLDPIFYFRTQRKNLRISLSCSPSSFHLLPAETQKQKQESIHFTVELAKLEYLGGVSEFDLIEFTLRSVM